MKRKWKPHYYKHSGPLPERVTLEMAAAREYLTTWEVTKDKALVDRHLSQADKVFGDGAEERIRQHMRFIAKHERIAK